MRTRLAPSRWIPTESATITREGLDAVVYCYSQAGKVYAVGYRAKACKPSFHFSFRTEERRQEQIEKFFANVKGMQDYRANTKADAAAKRAAGHGAKEGQIYFTSWGYDQTNIDFYQVVKTTPGSITVRRIAQDCREDGFMSGQNYPLVDQFCDEPKRCMFTGSGFSLKGNSLNKWAGQPVRSSWYA